MNKPLDLNEIKEQLCSLGRHCSEMSKGDDAPTIWRLDVSACNTAVEIIEMLQREGLIRPDQVQGLLDDYQRSAEQYRTLREKYEVPAAPIRKNSLYLCPACNHRVHEHHTHCHWCGKKLRDEGGFHR